MFYGKGAGKLPTASAVVADVVDALKNGSAAIPGLLTSCLQLMAIYAVAAITTYLQANLMAQLAQKGCKVFLVGGLLRPETEAIIGAAALHSLQQYNFTKAFLGANGVALDAGFTTPDPEEAAVKAAVVRRAREAWFLVDDSKFARIYPAVIAELSGGAILTNHCPNPKYRQFTLVKEAAE